MLLTDDEIQAIHEADDGAVAWGSYRAVEAAILAKLASAKLPEPATVTVLSETPYYTADQLRQAFAQGAASQLSAEPFTHYRHYDEQVQPFADEGTIPLFTLKEQK
jgi:hypothetical protein